jgi:hypothetical protein
MASATIEAPPGAVEMYVLFFKDCETGGGTALNHSTMYKIGGSSVDIITGADYCKAVRVYR